MIITSNSNELIKSIKKLYEKKYRDLEKKYIIEGIKIIYEAYKSNQMFLNIVICKEILDEISIEKEYINDLIKENKDSVIYVSENVFNSISDTITPQGILAVIKKDNKAKDITEDILFLDRVQDSGNVGTIIRTAAAFGFNTIVLNKGCADIYSQKVLRSTMGNIFNLNILCLDNDGISFLNIQKTNGYELYASALKNSNNIYDTDFSNKKIVIMGNEANGVCKEILDISNENILIPMQNNTESLNVAIATGIILAEIKRKCKKM